MEDQLDTALGDLSHTRQSPSGVAVPVNGECDGCSCPSFNQFVRDQDHKPSAHGRLVYGSTHQSFADDTGRIIASRSSVLMRMVLPQR